MVEAVRDVGGVLFGLILIGWLLVSKYTEVACYASKIRKPACVRAHRLLGRIQLELPGEGQMIRRRRKKRFSRCAKL